jgi:hypothetical protein
MLLGELPVALRVLRVHAEDKRIFGLGSLPVVSEFTKLFRTDTCVVPRIKDQDDVLAATEIGEGDSAAFLILHSEIGGRLPDRYRLRKQPGQNWHLNLS